MRARGTDAAVAARLKATQCASPAHVLTAITPAVRSRKKLTARENAPSASSPSRTTKTAASDNHQFRAQPAIQIPAVSKTNRTKARPGLGWESVESKLERMAAPPTESNIASISARRRTFSWIKARIGRGFPALSALVDRLSALVL